jgi:pimeloyl-ACP methyl ester carboxylesterase
MLHCPPMTHIHFPGVHLWYNDTGGTGVPVVFLHAASGTAASWVYQLPAFTTAGYRCITYDRRGWGQSQPDPGGAQPGHASEDLHHLVEHLRLERFHLVGTAAGGIVGLDYALSYPQRVRSLVVANSIGGIQDATYLEVQQRLRPPEIQALPVELREIGPSYRGTNPEGVRRWLEIEHSSGMGRTPAQPPRQPLTLALLATLQPPVLIVMGEADLLSPPALMHMLAAPIPHCQVVSVPAAGHAAFWEQPEIWNRLVLEFLRVGLAGTA